MHQRQLTLWAMGVAAVCLGGIFLSDLLGVLTGLAFFDFNTQIRPQRMVGLAVATLLGSSLIYLYWQGYTRVAQWVVLALVFVLPVVFDPRAFYYTIPQGFWVPFILALAICSLRWALLVWLVSIILVILSYPQAFQHAGAIAVSLLIATMLVAGRLIQARLVSEAQAAQQAAEQAATALRKSELHYRMLVEQSPIAIQVLAPDGATLRVNHAWEKLWGVPGSALAHYNIFQDAQLAEKGILAFLRRAYAGELVQFPIHQYDKSKTPEVPSAGGKLWVRAFAYPLFDIAGNLQEVVVLQEDVTERVLADEQVHYLAYFNPLTQLPNRRLFMDRLQQAVLASQRSKEYAALLLLDLDYFKTLNESDGYEVGDQWLVEVAHRLRQVVSSKDTVAHLGGDEYGIILETLARDEPTAANQAGDLAEHIRQQLQRSHRLGASQRVYQGAASIGLTLFVDHHTPAETLLRQAEVALYQAKEAGRNSVRFYNAAMQAVIDTRIALETAIRAGLVQHEFHLYYQPQVNRAGDVIGAEALLRWQRPGHGLVTPDCFVPLCEATGLILPLGRWVLETACAQLKQWTEQPLTQELQLAVNVSAMQFQQPDFVAQVCQNLHRQGISPERLKLELTESVVLGDIDSAVRKMQQLDALGVALSLDDFGTGYSSLTYLKRLPLKQLKIDQSFIRDIVQSPNGAAIVRAILAMSHSLGLQTLAEGVETPEQCAFLKQYECDACQGYLFGRPMPLTQFETWLAQHVAAHANCHLAPDAQAPEDGASPAAPVG